MFYLCVIGQLSFPPLSVHQLQYALALWSSGKILVCMSLWHQPESHDRIQDENKKRKKKRKDIASSTFPFFLFHFTFHYETSS